MKLILRNLLYVIFATHIFHPTNLPTMGILDKSSAIQYDIINVTRVMIGTAKIGVNDIALIPDPTRQLRTNACT